LSNLEITGAGSIQIETPEVPALQKGNGNRGRKRKGAGIIDPGGKKEKTESDSKAEDTEEDTWDPLKPKEEKSEGKGLDKIKGTVAIFIQRVYGRKREAAFGSRILFLGFRQV
jgi:hypothetical protein